MISTVSMQQSLAVTIGIARNWLNSGFHHIEVKAQQSLPMTNTGYRSHFMAPAELDQCESVEAFIREWLDDAAKSKQWQDYLTAQRQLRLL